MRLLLRRVRLDGLDAPHDLRIRGQRIEAIATGLAPQARERVIEGDGLLAFPGLINAHDHLTLNLLPHLGSPPYPNLYAFADAIYKPDDSPIRELVHGVPLADRILWSGYKNLIGGVTTVAHHDPYPRRAIGRTFPVEVVARYGWAHSLRYADDPVRAFRRSRGAPFVMHAAEGIDEVAGREIDQLDGLGLLAPNTVLVHAIAVSDSQRERMAETGTGVVWCPASNRYLYGRSAAADRLAAALPVALGTDSTLSGAATLLDEARAGLDTGLADAEALVRMMTTVPARLFRLRHGQGTLAPGSGADLILLPDRGTEPAATLLAARPRDLTLVLRRGEPRLASPTMAEALDLGDANMRVDDEPRWLVGDCAGLRQRIETAIADTADGGAAAFDALARNPLWSLLRPLH